MNNGKNMPASFVSSTDSGAGNNSVWSAGICRGEGGYGYVGLVAVASAGSISARAHVKGNVSLEVPVNVFSLELPSRRLALTNSVHEDYAVSQLSAWAVRLPLLACDVEVEVFCAKSAEDKPALCVDFPVLGSKIQSRLMTYLNRPLADALRHCEDANWTGRTRLIPLDAWPAAGDIVWRYQAIFATENGEANPWLRVLGPDAQTLVLDTKILEDHVVPAERDLRLRERFVTFSLRAPAFASNVVVECGIEGMDNLRGFSCLPLDESRRRIGDARARVSGVANDPAYEHWLDVHRSTWQDRLLQRGASRDKVPGVGLVLPAVSVCLLVCDDDLARDYQMVVSSMACVLGQSIGLQAVIVGSGNAFQTALGEAMSRVPNSVAEVVVVEGDGESPWSSRQVERGLQKATGDYVLFCDSHTQLELDAVWRFASEAARWGSAAPGSKYTDLPALLYGDGDVVRDGHYCQPSFRTFPNLGKLQVHDYMGDVFAIRKDVPDIAKWPQDGEGGYLPYDLALRVMEQRMPVAHVQRIVSHVNGDDYPNTHEKCRTALEGHLVRAGIHGRVEDGPLPRTFRIRYELTNNPPLVSVIIPSKDNPDLLKVCISSVLDLTTYPKFEVVVVENNSVQPDTFQLYDELKHDPRVRIMTWKPEPDGPKFNYSAIVNEGARQSGGKYLLLLNNDTQVIAPDWMDELVACFERPEVAVAGAKLLFADGLVQHAGMIANPNGDNAHFNQNLYMDDLGYECSAALPADMNMVTGACQMVRREVFDQLGGYDENLAVGFNDSEFCLRVREAGYAVTFTPYALLYHREFGTRGREALDVRLQARLLREKSYTIGRHASYYARQDQTINENLDHFSNYFGLKW